MNLRVALLATLALLPLILISSPAAAAPGATCVHQIDDLLTDGGTTYCVNPAGPCHVSESTEYIWGREYHCVA